MENPLLNYFHTLNIRDVEEHAFQLDKVIFTQPTTAKQSDKIKFHLKVISPHSQLNLKSNLHVLQHFFVVKRFLFFFLYHVFVSFVVG